MIMYVSIGLEVKGLMSKANFRVEYLHLNIG